MKLLAEHFKKVIKKASFNEIACFFDKYKNLLQHLKNIESEAYADILYIYEYYTTEQTEY